MPGVGRYILGAVLSQAFDRRLPIIEANTQRVLSRLFARREDPTSHRAKVWLWAKAEAILPERRVGDFNQALMELGALVCTPTAPRCEECPLSECCETNRLGLQSEIPVKAARRNTIAVVEVAGILRDVPGTSQARVLIVKRPDSGRWAGMWEFPHVELNEDENDPPTRQTALRRLFMELGFEIDTGPEVMTIRHTVTHHRIQLTALAATRISGDFIPGRYVEARWVSVEELTDYPVSSPQRKLIRAIHDRP